MKPETCWLLAETLDGHPTEELSLLLLFLVVVAAAAAFIISWEAGPSPCSTLMRHCCEVGYHGYETRTKVTTPWPFSSVSFNQTPFSPNQASDLTLSLHSHQFELPMRDFRRNCICLHSDQTRSRCHDDYSSLEGG